MNFMSDDLFGGDLTPTDHDEITVTLSDLMGEDKKYKTEADVAKAIVEKDRFIERLKREAAEAREAVQKRIKEEEFLDRLEVLTKAKPPEQVTNPEDRGDKQPAVKPEDLSALVRQELEREKAAAKRRYNLLEVENKLREVYGDDFRRRVQDHAHTLGVGTDFLTDVAAKSPDGFYRLLGLDAPARRPDDTAPPRSTARMPTAPAGSNVKDHAYWREQRQKNGDGWYFTDQVQKQIWESAQTLGERYFARA
jgi:hypothetical protein